MNKRALYECWLNMFYILVEKHRLAPKSGFARQEPQEFADAVQECLIRWRRGERAKDYLGHALVNLVELIRLEASGGSLPRQW